MSRSLLYLMLAAYAANSPGACDKSAASQSAAGSSAGGSGRRLDEPRRPACAKYFTPRSMPRSCPVPARRRHGAQSRVRSGRPAATFSCPSPRRISRASTRARNTSPIRCRCRVLATGPCRTQSASRPTRPLNRACTIQLVANEGFFKQSGAQLGQDARRRVQQAVRDESLTAARQAFSDAIPCRRCAFALDPADPPPHVTRVSKSFLAALIAFSVAAGAGANPRAPGRRAPRAPSRRWIRPTQGNRLGVPAIRQAGRPGLRARRLPRRAHCVRARLRLGRPRATRAHHHRHAVRHWLHVQAVRRRQHRALGGRAQTEFRR